MLKSLSGSALLCSETITQHRVVSCSTRKLIVAGNGLHIPSQHGIYWVTSVSDAVAQGPGSLGRWCSSMASRWPLLVLPRWFIHNSLWVGGPDPPLLLPWALGKFPSFCRGSVEQVMEDPHRSWTCRAWGKPLMVCAASKIRNSTSGWLKPTFNISVLPRMEGRSLYSKHSHFYTKWAGSDQCQADEYVHYPSSCPISPGSVSLHKQQSF